MLNCASHVSRIFLQAKPQLAGRTASTLARLCHHADREHGTFSVGSLFGSLIDFSLPHTLQGVLLLACVLGRCSGCMAAAAGDTSSAEERERARSGALDYL